MKHQAHDESDGVTLVLSEDLTLPYAEELKNIFVGTVGTGKDVRVKFDAVTEIDLSFLQVLCSAHRTAMRSKSRFEVDGPMPEECSRFIAEAGFVRHRGCRLNAEKEGCLWQPGVHRG